MYKFFAEKNLISPNQSGFKPGNSYINQLLSISDETYKSFDDEVPGIFLDISKEFNMAQGALVQTKTKWYFRKTVCYHHRFLKVQKQRAVLTF